MLGEFLHHLVVHRRSRVNERYEILPLVHHLYLVLAERLVEQRLLHLEDYLSIVIDLNRAVNHLGASLDIVLVVIERAVARRLLHKHFKTVFHKLTHSLRGSRHTILVVHDFLWNSNNHN